MRNELVEKRSHAIRDMFARVAARYDLLNHVLSLGADFVWRKRVTKRVAQADPKVVLDVCTGTGDLALAQTGSTVVGTDFCLPMLARARVKAQRRRVQLELAAADALMMPLRNGTVDVATVAFGVRNFEDLDRGIRELVRVTRTNGLIVILEFSRPRGILAPLLEWWARRVLPWVGRLVSRDGEAYSYLPESIRTFPEGSAMCELLRQNGLAGVTATPLTWGVATMYVGVKSERG